MKRILSAIIVTLLVLSSVSQVFGASTTKAYSDKKLCWSINILSAMAKETGGKENEAVFKDKDNTQSLNINMYSAAGLTLDSWVARETKKFKENYNTGYFNFLKTEAGTLNGIKFKKVYLKYFSTDKWYNVCIMYMVGKNYRYEVSYALPSDDYKIAAKKSAMDALLGSFKFTEPVVKTLGVLAEDSDSIDSAKHIKIENAQYGWSYEVPDTWKKILDNDGFSLYQANNYQLFTILTVNSNAENKSLADCAKDYEAGLSKDKAGYKIKSKSTVNAGGNEYVTYSISFGGINLKSYITALNGNVYILELFIAQYVDIPKNSKVLDTIWKSFKISDTGTGNSIKDYTPILKGQSKGVIGDSYYNWSFTPSKDMKVSTRSFNGTYTLFVTDDQKSAFQVFIYNNDKNLSLDTISANLLEAVKKDYTVIASEKRNEGGQEYAMIAYRGDKDDFVNEHRTFIVGNRIFQIILTVEQEAYTKKTYSTILDSFKTTFSKDGSADDLSDVNSSGLRPYKNRNFSWSMDVLPEWSEIKPDNKGNNVQFLMDEDNYAFVSMYSIESGLTLEKWIQDELNKLDTVYNKNLVTYSKPEDMTIKGINCKRINLSYNINGKMYYESFIYALGKNYRYMLGYSLDSTNYKDTAVKAGFENVVASFSFTEPDVNKVGKLFDPNMANYSSSTRTVSSKRYQWSVALPNSFTAGEENNDDNNASYLDSNNFFYFYTSVYDAEASVEKYATDEVKYYKDHSSLYTYVSTETLSEKGTTVKKLTYKYSNPNDYFGYYVICYILVKNGYAYYVTFEVTDIRNTAYSSQTFKTIWDSMTF